MQITMLPIKSISFNDQYTRFQAVEGDRLSDTFRTGLNNLAQNIKNNGLIHPITVKQIAENEWLVIAGNRRLRALQLLKWKEVPCIISEKAEDDFMIAFSENMQRMDITDPEKGEWITKAIEHLKPTEKFKDAKKPVDNIMSYLSTQLGISVRTMHAYRNMAKNLSADTKAAIKAGRAKAHPAAKAAAKKRQAAKGKPKKQSISTIITGTEKRFCTLTRDVLDKLKIVDDNYKEFAARKGFLKMFNVLLKALRLTERRFQ